MNHCLKKNNITTGQIYKAVLDKERGGHYLGQTVQYIPHIIDEIKQRVLDASKEYEIAIIEIGGTVGDYENTPYLFALKSLQREIGIDHMAFILVTYLPVPDHIGEMKSKPTQQAIRLLGQEGILPDFVVCRAKYPLDEIRRKKIAAYANIPNDHIISAPDIDTVYQIPLDLEQEKLGEKILTHLDLSSRKKPDWTQWKHLLNAIKNPERRVAIAIVGKYFDTGNYSLTDSYLSIYQALIHAGAHNNCGVHISWIDAKKYETSPLELEKLSLFDGVIIPGGFGASGVEGKIKAIEFVRTRNIPYLGLCYGMQLAAIEFARNVCNLADAHTTEVNPATPHPIIDILPTQREILETSDYGGTMRLGLYEAKLKEDSKIAQLYRAAGKLKHDQKISERHRHRYEVNPRYIQKLEEHGIVFSGTYEREDKTQLMEYLELPAHSFFIATQAHPEFTSRLERVNPLFDGFVKACLD